MKLLRRLIPYTLVILALVVVLPILAGCAGKDKSNRFNELLGLIPADADLTDSLISIIDYKSFREDYDISLTTDDDQPITFEEYAKKVADTDVQYMFTGHDIIGYGRYAIDGNIRDEYVGYDFSSVDAYIIAGHPPVELIAAIGRFDPQATREALNNQDEWPDWAVEAYNTEEHNGVTVHSWGDGFSIHIESAVVPPHIDMLGRAMPLAITSEYLFYTSSQEDIKSMIDASQDDIESLADLPEFAEIVNKLSELNVYTALLGLESIANGAPQYEGIYPGPRLKRFETFGSAPGTDEKGEYNVLVLYHENPDDAKANVSLLEERINSTNVMVISVPWTDFYTEIDIFAEGNLLVAKLYTEHKGSFQDWVYGCDPLLLHEE